jgi:hypothetical protein|tara:strand:- start:1981 stop:2394 length:414 start_codon:yes stop_codon:yes gene_type:complete
MKSIFDWLKEINYKKSPPNSFSDKDWEVWNSYMIHRFISMNPDYIELVNEVQIMDPRMKKEIYNIYKEFIPKNNKWSKYIKSKIKQPNKDLVKLLKDHFNVSSREIKDFLKILDTKDINHILTNKGLEKKEIKTLLK